VPIHKQPEVTTLAPIKTLATAKDHNPTLITPQETGVIIIQDEATVPLVLIPTEGVPRVIVPDREAIVVEVEAAQEVDNIELKFNDYEKVHPSCPYPIFIHHSIPCTVYGRHLALLPN
tara:strand:+ start:41 stop:394 length:354 start_codon:yes stop_codon:yes gene_type:complete